MKKIYNSPITTVVELKSQSALMALSIYNQDANSAGMSRNNSSWDDEDDDY